MNKNKKTEVSVSHKRSGYMAGTIVIVIAVFILLNLIVGQLPSNLRELDMTDNELYEVSDTSIAFLSELDKDVDLIVLAEPETTDSRILKFLDKYVAHSGHLSVEVVDPVSHPIVLTEYNAEINSVVIRCEETGKQRSVLYSDIIVTDWYNYLYQGGAPESEFDADGQITSAVDFVTSEQDTMVYTVNNHGEADIPESAAKSLNKANLIVSSTNLLLDGGIPADCAELIFYQPTTDLADDELDMLETYLDNGGSIYYIPSNTGDQLKNFSQLMRDYGLEIVPGYIADTGRYYQQYGSAYAIFATPVSSSPVTSSLSTNDLILVIYSRGMQQVDPIRDTITVAPFLKTSEQGVAVSETGEAAGTYILGAVSTDSASNGTLSVISAYSLVDENIVTSFPNVLNMDVFVDAATTPIAVDDVSIPSKSLEIIYNTITDPLPATIVFVGVLPVSFLVAGFYLWFKRRKL